MQVYLPIAELSMNLFFLVGIGGAVGFLSGLFGVGGGFLLTPLLIFSGVPSSVAVASVTGQVVAASTSGALSYYRRGQIDLHMAMYLVLSGVLGAFGGVATFQVLRAAGQLDLVISLGFLILLGFVGTLMLIEAARAIMKRRAGIVVREKLPNQHNWFHGLPWRVRFKKSRLYISVIPVLALGVAIGFVGSLLGIGGGFILVPALVYILRMPGNMVIGTSLLQVVAMMAATTILHAVSSQSVDILLAFCLMVGGTVGAQFGASAGKYLRGEQLRALLAILVLAVAIRFGISLVMTPGDVYSTAVIGASGVI
ncbi:MULTISPECIES: sulfite exporter TauE/SafE family protein [unclassified Devosia]|uniref:sulfite exporter TauE/SafE family protein n=1 Tax=unclassified Devosia TaxID=196773 RepID=UPI00086EA484|nr:MULTISPECIES: sulfite exporter TauE/SafE family protein [unclassified Devosia]MBN9360818.1 sulfite exporter TauE/SafE family protein [Devosia sp.]ODS88199.1 MAG: permease [Devosia sp. SCN 66-27]OJX22774.1 MAG: permease [Devosia sp. 66-14]